MHPIQNQGGDTSDSPYHAPSVTESMTTRYNNNRIDYWISLANSPGFSDPPLNRPEPPHEPQGPNLPFNSMDYSSQRTLSSSGSVRNRPWDAHGTRPGSVDRHATSPQVKITATRTATSEVDRASVVGKMSHPRPNTRHQLATLSGRLQLVEDGHLRYFGPASNLHLVHSGSFSLYRPRIRTIREHADSCLSARGLNWAGDAEFEAKLTGMFFAWDNPLLQAVEKGIYHREKGRFYKDKDTWLFSPTLENAMYATKSINPSSCPIERYFLTKLQSSRRVDVCTRIPPLRQRGSCRVLCIAGPGLPGH
jgi:hypothetical protein